MKGTLAPLLFLLLAGTGWTQTREELELRLKSADPNERAAALQGFGTLKTSDASLLDVVAASLLDEVEDVRTTAAYSLAGVAGKVGCNLDELLTCKLIKSVLDSPPKVSKSIPPRYPLEAKEQGIQGRVRLEILIEPGGTVARLRIVDGPAILREPAAAAVKQWKWNPAMRSGRAVPFAMISVVTFRLN